MNNARLLKKSKLISLALITLLNSSTSIAAETNNTQVVTDQTINNDANAETLDTAPVAHPHHKKKIAATDDSQSPTANHDLNLSPVVERASTEQKILQNPFSIAFYKPTYVLPFYYTRSPDNAVYVGETPEGESLKKSEVKYQLSFKVPLWQRIFNLPTSLYFAYTQMSYWQLYDRDPFFRETDYEPEFFLANELNWHLIGSWHLNFFSLGGVHQSNGFGGAQERSWNRAYLSATASSENWVIQVRPWYVFHDATYERQNPNMADFLGHEQFIIAYKFHNQELALEARNVVEQHARHAAFTGTWSFPITQHLNGYFQAFSGYGQSLIEYNHRTNSFGIGIALSNWV